MIGSLSVYENPGPTAKRGPNCFRMSAVPDVSTTAEGSPPPLFVCRVKLALALVRWPCHAKTAPAAGVQRRRVNVGDGNRIPWGAEVTDNSGPPKNEMLIFERRFTP